MKAQRYLPLCYCTHTSYSLPFPPPPRQFICNLCERTQPVPCNYYSPLDSSGFRSDLKDKAELSSGSFDIVVGEEYVSRAPMAPTFIFLIDVSRAAVESGMLKIVTNSIHAAIMNDSLAGGEQRTQIGIVTYDSKIHVYNLQS